MSERTKAFREAYNTLKDNGHDDVAERLVETYTSSIKKRQYVSGIIKSVLVYGLIFAIAIAAFGGFVVAVLAGNYLGAVLVLSIGILDYAAILFIHVVFDELRNWMEAELEP